ncbi:glycosyltransferase [Actinomycetospora flava]|uniref:Glycosyltransferase n=1 Tax=Actinomycetospora flava TaxID=3129232 RepID=A0ABU8M559_9PSEU
MRRRTVLIVGLNYAPEPTGIARYTTGLARMLAEAGHSVHVVTGFPHYPEWRIADGYRGARIEETDGPATNPIRVTRVVHPVPARPTGLGRVLMEAVFAARAATVRTTKPDVVVVVSPALLSVAAARWRWHRSGRTALGVVTQDLYTAALAETGALRGRGAGAARRLERTLLQGADGVAAIHDTFRASLERLGVDPARITVVRNWTHTAPASGDTAALRTRLGWPDGDVIALHAGNMGAKQGLENVVDAARLADERRLPITFVLMGDGNQRAALEARAEGVQRLRFQPSLPDGEFETALAAADVLVLNERPGIAEMCVPSKLTSYFAAGRPVIAATADDGAAATEVRAADAGIVLPPARPELLVEAACALGADRTGADRLGSNACHYAARVYAERTARAHYLAWVDSLASRVSITVPAPRRSPDTATAPAAPPAPVIERQP